MSTATRKLLRISVLGLTVAGSAAAQAQVPIPDIADPLLAGLTIPDDAADKGMWSATYAWPLIGIHAALTPSGSVLTYGAPPGKSVQDGRTFAIWAPEKGFSADAHTVLPNAQAIDSFCATGTALVSGAMLISGGSSTESGFSSQASTAFDPARRSPTVVASQLAHPRWYGTLITLPDGRPLMVGGGKPYVTGAYNDPDGALARGEVSMTPEVYGAGTGWTPLPGATSRDAFGPDFNRWWYPRLWVTPRGSVFGISSDKTWFLRTAGSGSIASATFKAGPGDASRPNTGPTSTAAMFDTGRILQVGGNGFGDSSPTPSSAQATIFDVNGKGLAMASVAPMAFPRQWASATVLPNGRVLVTGGTRFANNAGTDAVYEAEIWNPATRRWSRGARAAQYRGYHSTAILLQNGTVLTTGGGVPGPVNNLNSEIYYPPYLFARVDGRSVLAPRPRLASIGASQYAYGAPATIALATEGAVASVALIGLAHATHGFDSGQRFQRLAFTQNGQILSVTMPGNANLAPPGYYQIVVADAAGVPSRGVIVALAAAAPQPAQAGSAPQASGLQPVALPGYRVRQARNLGVIGPLSAASLPSEKLDAAFIVRPGLSDPACLSFESRSLPGGFLRHADSRLRLSKKDRFGSFKDDATFCQRPGLAGQGTSYESFNRPGHFLRYRGTELWLDPVATDSAYKSAASFNLVDALP